MQTVSTFLEAGRDFVDETVNGYEDIWWILEGQDYPRLWWEPSFDLLLTILDDFSDFRLGGSRRSPYNDNGTRALPCCESI
jgi:hypothetical protein